MTADVNAGTNLARAEARDRATKVFDVSYTAVLDLTAGGETFTSRNIVRFLGNPVGAATFIELEAAHVHAATLNGRRVPIDAYDKSRSRLSLRGLLARNELTIIADCSYQHSGVGMHRFVDPADGNVYLHTQFEPYEAHSVFACFDQPDIRATFALTVIAPEDWTVVSNSPVARQRASTRESRGKRRKIWRFAPTPVIATYLAAVVAGPYREAREIHRHVEMGLFCRESLTGYLDTAELFALTRQGLDFFEEEFGCRYPFEKYDQLFVPDLNLPGMENAGCVTLNEDMLFRARTTESSHESRAKVLLHEMAHMWFGNLISIRWWDDLWLKESFATYMATDALARATRFSGSWIRFTADVKARAVAEDQMPTSHPISTDIRDTDAVRLHFDAITYLKGASVVKQLAAWVGPEAFVNGLRLYFRRREWATAELTDLLSALEETSRRDLTPWSEEWLETAGVNTLRASFTLSGGTYGSFAILQEGRTEFDTLRSHRVAVGLYRLNDAGLMRDRRIELDVQGKCTEVPELAGETIPDLLLLNDEDLTYAKVRLDDLSLTTVADHLNQIVDPMARNLCWAALVDMVRDGELPTRRFVALILAHASDEPDDAMLQRLMAHAVTFVDVYGDPSNWGITRAALSKAARSSLFAAAPGTDRQLIWARIFLSVAAALEDLTFARSLLRGTADVPGLSLDTDLRWRIVLVLARAAADDDGEIIEAELDRDRTDLGERWAAASRASRPTSESKSAAWAQLTEGIELPVAIVRAIAEGFHQIGQDELLEPYVQPYFDALPRFWTDRSRKQALSLARGLYPRTLVGERMLEATDRALEREALPDAFRRILLESKDGIERAIRGRAADSPGGPA